MANRQTFLGSLDSTNVVCRGERIFHVTMGTPEYEKYNLSFPLALKISTEFEAFYLRPFIYFYKKRITCLIFFLYNFTQGGLCRSQSASCHRRPWLGAPWPPGPPVTRCSPQAWSPPGGPGQLCRGEEPGRQSGTERWLPCLCTRQLCACIALSSLQLRWCQGQGRGGELR